MGSKKEGGRLRGVADTIAVMIKKKEEVTISLFSRGKAAEGQAKGRGAKTPVDREKGSGLSLFSLKDDLYSKWFKRQVKERKKGGGGGVKKALKLRSSRKR